MRRFVILKIASMLCFLLPLSTFSVTTPASQRLVLFNGNTSTPSGRAAEQGAPALHVSSLMDLYYLLRMHAASKSLKPVAINGFDEAVNATREMQNVFGGPASGAWGILDSEVVDCQDSAELTLKFGRLPESVRGGTIPVREGAVRMAKAMNAIEPLFLKKIWPKHKSVLDKNSDQLLHLFGSKGHACLTFIGKNLRMEDWAPELNFYLVAELPEPGSITYFLRSGRRISVISASTDKGFSSSVAMLYEATHIFRALSTHSNVLTDLEDRLKSGGASNEAVRNAVLTLIFVQSAETVRRILDPSHKLFGKHQEAQARFPLMNSLVMPVWIRYLNGESSYGVALDQLVAGFLKANKG
jgi:hypothetical protein